MEGKIIGLIGGPGVGKTFLADKLMSELNAILLMEDVESFPADIIDNFTNDKNHVETILWFRNKCILRMEEALKLKAEGKNVVMDTFLLSNALHITSMVEGFSREVLLEQASIDSNYFSSPDVVLFLDASEDKIRELTLVRGREFDTTDKFLKRNISIRNAHRDYYQKHESEIVYIQRDKMDFDVDADLNYVVEKIKEKF